MTKLIETEKGLPWIEAENIVEVFISDEMPPIAECASAYTFVFKDEALLQTELRKGERPARQLDIPGGHIDASETPEQAAIRETFEETGVRVAIQRLLGYSKISILSECPPGYRYPCPVSYMLFYEAIVIEETPFEGNEDAHGRVWLPFRELGRSEWVSRNKRLVQEIFSMLSKKSTEII